MCVAIPKGKKAEKQPLGKWLLSAVTFSAWLVWALTKGLFQTLRGQQ